MDILNTISLESNSCFKMNFNGGDLSSDAGLLMLYDFMRAMYVQRMVAQKAHCERIRISTVCAWNTSRLAFDGTGRVKEEKNQRRQLTATVSVSSAQERSTTAT